MYKILLPGEPHPQQRPRLFKRGNRSWVYDPQSLLKKQLRDQVKTQIEDIAEFKQLKYPRVIFWFFMPIPKSMSKSERIDAESELLKHVKKPDVDNLVKLYLDVLSGLTFEDDNCVSIGRACKIYSNNPRTLIFLDETTKLISTEELYGGTWLNQAA